MKNNILIITLLLLVNIAFAQSGEVKFEAKADAKQVLLGNYFQINFTLFNAEGDRFQAPKFDGFKILSGPNQNSNMTIIQGQVSRSVGYSYYLQPEKVGKFIIPSATITVKGKTLKSNPVTIEVLAPKGSNAKTQEDLNAQIEEKVFIKAVVNKKQPYIGEQIILDFKLYTTIGIDNYNMVSEPSFEGFFAKEIAEYDTEVIREVHEGEQYSTKIIRRIALFPQKAGQLEIEPMILNIGLSTGQRSPFGSFFSSPMVTRQISSEAVMLNVKSVPQNQPESFSGAVGKYRIQTVMNNQFANTEESLMLNLKIVGDGDVKRVLAPRLTLPSDTFEIYDPQVNESITESGGQIFGTKIIDYMIVPKVAGKYEFTPEFTYFDTDTEEFVTLTDETFALAIAKNNRPESAVIENNIVSFATPIKGIKTATAAVKPHRSFYGTPLFWILFLLPVAGLGGIYYYKQLLIKKGNIDPILLKRKKANAMAQKRLATANQYLQANHSRQFYDEISRALWGYISDKLNMPISQLTKENVNTKLLSIGISQDGVDKFLKSINTCEMALFAGMDNSEAMKQTYEDAVKVITTIEGTTTSD